MITKRGIFVLSLIHCIHASSLNAADLDKKYASIPKEVQKNGVDFGGADTDDATVAVFCDFSWQSFIALNWPSQDWPAIPQRGIPDKTLDFSETFRPRVWETWKSGFETIPKQPSHGSIVQPLLWNQVGDATPVGGTTLTKPKVFGSNTLYGDISQAEFGGFAAPLICQNHTYTHFEVHVNRPEFDTIRGEDFYLIEAINAHAIDPHHDDFQYPNGSITVKASWRELQVSEDPTTYYVREADVLDYQNGGSDRRKLGLVGFHIVAKTPLRKQWIWISFEHARNVPGLTTGTGYSYNDSSNAGLSNEPAKVGDPSNLYVSPTPSNALVPAQAVRQNPLHAQTILANTKYHAMLPTNSVWRNYHLVMTQWPTTPNEPDEKPFPADPTNAPTDINVSNTTMETWHQATSCISCHKLAEEAGFDYVFFPSIHAQRSPTGFAAAMATPAASELQQKIRRQLDKSVLRSRELQNNKR